MANWLELWEKEKQCPKHVHLSKVNKIYPASNFKHNGNMAEIEKWQLLYDHHARVRKVRYLTKKTLTILSKYYKKY